MSTQMEVTGSLGSGSSSNSRRDVAPRTQCSCGKEVVDTQCDTFRWIKDGNCNVVEDLQFQLLEKDNTISKIEFEKKN